MERPTWRDASCIEIRPSIARSKQRPQRSRTSLHQSPMHRQSGTLRAKNSNTETSTISTDSIGWVSNLKSGASYRFPRREYGRSYRKRVPRTRPPDRHGSVAAVIAVVGLQSLYESCMRCGLVISWRPGEEVRCFPLGRRAPSPRFARAHIDDSRSRDHFVSVTNCPRNRQLRRRRFTPAPFATGTMH